MATAAVAHRNAINRELARVMPCHRPRGGDGGRARTLAGCVRVQIEEPYHDRQAATLNKQSNQQNQTSDTIAASAVGASDCARAPVKAYPKAVFPYAFGRDLFYLFRSTANPPINPVASVADDGGLLGVQHLRAVQGKGTKSLLLHCIVAL